MILEKWIRQFVVAFEMSNIRKATTIFLLMAAFFGAVSKFLEIDTNKLSRMVRYVNCSVFRCDGIGDPPRKYDDNEYRVPFGVSGHDFSKCLTKYDMKEGRDFDIAQIDEFMTKITNIRSREKFEIGYNSCVAEKAQIKQ